MSLSRFARASSAPPAFDATPINPWISSFYDGEGVRNGTEFRETMMHYFEEELGMMPAMAARRVINTLAMYEICGSRDMFPAACEREIKVFTHDCFTPSAHDVHALIGIPRQEAMEIWHRVERDGATRLYCEIADRVYEKLGVRCREIFDLIRRIRVSFFSESEWKAKLPDGFESAYEVKVREDIELEYQERVERYEREEAERARRVFERGDTPDTVPYDPAPTPGASASSPVGYTPTEPGYYPTSPLYSPTTPTYDTPVFSPFSSPEIPASSSASPASPEYSPDSSSASPAYVPTSPSYNPDQFDDVEMDESGNGGEDF